MTREEKDGAAIVEEIYSSFEAAPDQRWNISDVWNRFHAKCTESKNLQKGALASYVTRVVGLVDDRHTKHRSRTNTENQGLLWPEWAELGGSYALLDGKRVAKRYAKLDDLRIVLKIHDANTEAQAEANHRLHQEFERLEPYMQDPTVTKEMAVTKWVEDHPMGQAN